ncbi:YwiC-like family protein [Corynebacterium frankenforstense]|uniref:YwiC-like family protein n=1 Tax=Corynebacterium TaxID=1716 RepID=UPI00254CE5DE|nr:MULTISPECIES: YwiC-like family protein [Corynebacterium]MDK6259471.1 YwiC-like family protein [Corynebacterium frankenforstense]MDK8895103.1 YwiC-like family protein [Corynebacterium sp. MSK006]
MRAAKSTESTGTTGKRAERPARKRRRGISPWVPNQHGAWAMLIAPAVVGTIVAVMRFAGSAAPARSLLVLLAVLVAWFFGYGAFFAFGMVAKARTPERRRQYVTPVYVYGAVAAVAAVLALALHPQLAWWAVFFGPLIAVACVETLRGRARSTLSGVSTTIASALLVAVLVQVGEHGRIAQIPAAAWVAVAVLAMFFSGAVTYVKSMIRQKGNRRYLAGSVAYHAVALIATVILVAAARAGWLGGVLLVAAMAWALVRSWYYPHRAAAGEKFTPKQVGMKENPPLLLACFGALFAAI